MSSHVVRNAQGFVSRIQTVDADAPVVRTPAEKSAMHASIRQMARDAMMRR